MTPAQQDGLILRMTNLVCLFSIPSLIYKRALGQKEHPVKSGEIDIALLILLNSRMFNYVSWKQNVDIVFLQEWDPFGWTEQILFWQVWTKLHFLPMNSSHSEYVQYIYIYIYIYIDIYIYIVHT